MEWSGLEGILGTLHLNPWRTPHHSRWICPKGSCMIAHIGAGSWHDLQSVKSVSFLRDYSMCRFHTSTKCEEEGAAERISYGLTAACHSPWLFTAQGAGSRGPGTQSVKLNLGRREVRVCILAFIFVPHPFTLMYLSSN